MAPGSHWAERISLRYTQRCPVRMRSAPRALITTAGSAKFPLRALTLLNSLQCWCRISGATRIADWYLLYQQREPHRQTMKLSELNFHLPEELIAQKPLEQRDASRMLLLDRASGRLDDRRFRELPELLRGDELIVFNNTRVIPARLFGKRIGIHASEPSVHSPTRHEHLQAQIEVLLIRQLEADTWKTLVRPGRKIPIGERIIFGDGDLEGKVEARGDFGLRVIRFSSKTGFHEALDRLGHIPLPPYIKRSDEPLDRERYQTVYAKQGCAVAAPTAGLHFTSDLLARLSARGIET